MFNMDNFDPAKPISKKIMLKAFHRLDELLKKPVILLMGGGGSMILAHQFPLSTTDVDAVPIGLDFSEIDELAKKIAREMSLPPDWLNPYFSTFSYTLPKNYEQRLIDVFEGQNLRVRALGKEEMLIMKCFAHRPKDVGHGRQLLRIGADITLVENHIESLREKGIKEAELALDFLDELCDYED